MSEALATPESETVFAVVAGAPLKNLPEDLFIPPDALEILLESFTGPLDLLLYLIRKQDIDILNIPMTQITRQYMQYIELMKNRKLELAADYLAMAALLMEIKSKMLLPAKVQEDNEIEEDPRMALVKRLQIYELYKQAADWIDHIPRCDRDVYPVDLSHEHLSIKQPEPAIEVGDLIEVMIHLMEKQSQLVHHQITREPLSIRERMSIVLERLEAQGFLSFNSLYYKEEGRMGVVVSLLAILELAKQALLSITQTKAYSPIHIKAIDNG